MREQIEFSTSPAFRAFVGGLETLGDACELIHGIFIDLHPLRLRWPRAIERIEPRLSARIVTFRSALMVRLCVEPGPPPARELIEQYALKQPFLVIGIEEPVAVLAANVLGGGDVSATRPGTIGGFLQDSAGKRWGVTCGHVAQSVGMPVTLETVESRTAAGTVKHSNFSRLVPQPHGAACNRYVGPAFPSVDAALFELEPAHRGLCWVKSVGKVDAILNRMQFNTGDRLDMYGAVSRRNSWVVGGLGYSAKVKMSGNYYCFSHVFDFSAPRWPAWMPGRIAAALAPRALQGDSGAWLCKQYPATSSYAYAGNMIAVKGLTGIATFADALLDWADNDCGLKLHPY